MRSPSLRIALEGVFMFKPLAAAALTFTAVLLPAAQGERINEEINARIRAEGQNNSQIMRTMHFLTDVHGPRLTGSPNHKAAPSGPSSR